MTDVTKVNVVNLLRLGPWEEAVGLLHRVEQEDELLKLTLRPNSVATIVITDQGGELRSKLIKMVGRMIGVLRTDDGYRIRLMKQHRKRRFDL